MNAEPNPPPPSIPKLPKTPIYRTIKPPINAAEVCLVVLCMWSGAYAAARVWNNELLPIDQLLGRGWAIAWVIGLLGGAAMDLLGMFWPGKQIIAVAMLEIGYTAFAIATIARCVALIGVGQADTLPVYAIFVIGTLGRVIQLEMNLAQHSGVPVDRMAQLLLKLRRRRER